MEWLTRMNQAMDYIEMNLCGEIELTEIAQRACCSSHEFQKNVLIHYQRNACGIYSA